MPTKMSRLIDISCALGVLGQQTLMAGGRSHQRFAGNGAKMQISGFATLISACRSTPYFLSQRVKPHRESGIAAYKIGEYALGLSNNLDLGEALEDFLPQNAQLHFTQPVPHTAVDAEAEG